MTRRDGALRESLPHWAPYAVVTLIAAASAYFQVFTAFFFVDDEGYVLLSLQQFAGGHHLYNDVFSQYGPFLYESYGAFFKVTGLPFTTDVGRMITWVLWIVTALGYGLVAERLTGNRWIGLLAQLGAFPILFLSAREPMHPTGPTALLVLVVLALVVRGGATKKTTIAIGAVIGAIALIKINVGALAGVGIVVAAMLTLGRTHPRRWQAGALALALLTPLALMKANLDIGFYREFLFLAAVWPATALARAAYAADPREDDSPPAPTYLAWLAAGVAGSAAVICAIIFALGTSVSGLVHGVLIDPLSHPAEIIGSPQILGISLWLSAFMLAGVALWPRLSEYPRARALTAAFSAHSLALRGAIRILAAVVSVLCIARVQWVGLPNIAVAVPALLAWLVVVAPPEFSETRGQRFTRAAVVFVAIFETLQAYPAPGAQLLSGMLTFVLVAALLAGDGLRLVVLYRETAAEDDGRVAAFVVAATAVALAINLFAFGMVRPGHKALQDYRAGVATGLPGASRVHLQPPQAQSLQATVNAIKAQNCQTLLTVPGMNSFYHWTGVAPPTGENLTHWFIVLDSKRQQRVVDAIRDKPGVCILRNDAIINWWVGTSKDNKVQDRPLWDYLQKLPVTDISSADQGTYGAYRVQVPDPNGRATPWKQ